MSTIAEIIADRILSEATGVTEEDVKIACEQIFVEEFKKIGISYAPKYEVQIESGRVDALFNYLCVEYKKPGLVLPNFIRFCEEKSKYLATLAKKYQTNKDQIIGVLLDGRHIGFFRYTYDGNIRHDGPYPVNAASIQTLILYAQTTTRKALIGENVLESFGHNSVITKNLIQALWQAISAFKDTRTKMFLHEWQRLFGQISPKGGDAVIREAAMYDIHIDSEAKCQQFIFTVHSAYALIIKHIALMILSARKNAGGYNLADELRKGRTNLKAISEQIESGKEYISLGIKNFLEGDYFCWYVYEWSENIASSIKNIIFELATYEPQTGTLKPEAVRDLMKQLYEGLLSKEMRHSLGEYYTPDWLAEYTLKASGFRSGMRILDPTCGSGTFLVIAIAQMISESEGAPNLKEILSHVYGFDLNPLAVISARTNYILAIEPFLDQATESIELPVYLGDAIFSPSAEDGVYTYFLDSDAGRITLTLPEELSLASGSLSRTLSKMEDLVSCIYRTKVISKKTATEELKRFLRKEAIPSEHLMELFDKLCSLEEKHWDGIWCNIIKNYFATAQVPVFDIIIGNPPWVRWSDLPVHYRNTIKDFCQNYDLFSSDKYVGGVESDISTMVLYSAADKWLRSGGKLAMLITRTVFKTESSEGFRKFQIPHTDIKFKVMHVEDFTAIRPFENAINKPSLLVIEKGDEKTTFPVPWFAWEGKTKNLPKPYDSLEAVMQNIQRNELAAYPVGGEGSPWLTVPQDELEACLIMTRKGTETQYHARKGICTDLNGLYYGHIVGPYFQNSFGDRGRTKDMTAQTVKIELELLHPIARGKEISSFGWKWAGEYGILPQEGMHGYTIVEMMEKYPCAFRYFTQYKEMLESRSSLKRYLSADPFYTCWNVGPYSFATYKVCWREISNKLQSCVISVAEGQIVVPDHKIYFVPTENEDEAHYLCAVLNASAIEKLVLNYAESTQIGTHIFDYIHIPIFNKENPQHIQLAALSKMAHERKISSEDAIMQINRLIQSKGL